MSAETADVEAAVVKALGRPAPSNALVDLGTGSGRMLTLLGARATSSIGLDLSAAHAQHRPLQVTSRRSLEGVDFRHGDIYDTRLPAQSADLVVVHQVLHFLADPGRAIAEASRLLKPGGRLLIADFEHHNFEIMREQYQHRRLGMLDEDMRSWLEAAGLTPGASVALPPKARSGPSRVGLTVKIWLAEKTL
jgi:ubiquinone/menaquinone biosynthesis C-methylase UbiE